MRSRKRLVALAVAFATLGLGLAAGAQDAKAARPATLTVSPSGHPCPGARFHSIRDAVETAHAGDTVFVCAGTYAEGTGKPGSNALQITKDLRLVGAGADEVTVSPRRQDDDRIAADEPEPP